MFFLSIYQQGEKQSTQHPWLLEDTNHIQVPCASDTNNLTFRETRQGTKEPPFCETSGINHWQSQAPFRKASGPGIGGDTPNPTLRLAQAFLSVDHQICFSLQPSTLWSVPPQEEKALPLDAKGRHGREEAGLCRTISRGGFPTRITEWHTARGQRGSQKNNSPFFGERE